MQNRRQFLLSGLAVTAALGLGYTPFLWGQNKELEGDKAMKIYRGMDRATLDAAYNNSKAVADFPGILADFRARSEATYKKHTCKRNLAYGSAPRQRYDYFPHPSGKAPTFIFIHGGYWQACEKEDFAFIANGPLASGFNVVLVEYTLAPEASMTQIVGEIGMLLEHLRHDRDQLGIAQRPVCLSGHSAGGHLTAMYRSHPLVTHAMPISALVDLEPIALSWLDEKLKLTPSEVKAYSPIHHISSGAPVTVTVGGGELPELVRQSREYAEACQKAKQTASLTEVANCNHFTVLDDLEQEKGVQLTLLRKEMRMA